MVRINIPSNNSIRLLQQAAIVIEVLNVKKSKEAKILAYMLKHSSGGAYIIKRGYKADIAKHTKLGSSAVKKMISRLVDRKLIKYVSNELGNNMGVYMFHPALETLSNQTESLTFKFKNT